MPQLLAVLIAVVLTQSPPSPPDKTSPAITLSGCISRNVPARTLTLLDAESGARYRLTGKTVRKYAGRRVEIVGALPSSRLKVRGGLLPSPNAAAQSGAMDPTRAAVAGMSSGMGSGSADDAALPEFQVARVRTLDGSCQ